MKEEKSAPFSALTFAQQQEKWREWRSRQWDYKDAQAKEEAPAAGQARAISERAAPTRHGELDRLYTKHAQAARRAGGFRAATAEDRRTE